MYPSRVIDKVWELGETSAVDPELREAFDRLAVDLRGEIRSGNAEIRASVEASATETRRHAHVIGESARGDIRSLAELMGISNERTDQRLGVQTGRTEAPEGRVLRVEARVTSLEDDRTPRRARRRRSGGR